MKKIKLFSISEKKFIEGSDAELYFNLYFILSKDYGFKFLIVSPDHACSDRHFIKLIKHWLMLIQEDYVTYLRRYERKIGE